MTRGRNERRRVNRAARILQERIWDGFASFCPGTFNGEHIAYAQAFPPDKKSLLLNQCPGCNQPIERRWLSDGTLGNWTIRPYFIQEEP